MKIIKRIYNSIESKSAFVAGLLAMLIIPVTFSFAEWKNDSLPYPADLYAMCFDGTDNDGDGKTDLADSDCPRCNNGIDDDGDGFIDEEDPDCPRDEKKTFGEILGAFFADDDDSVGSGGSIESGGSIASGGSIGSGGSIVSCTEVKYELVRNRDKNGPRYIYEFECVNEINSGRRIRSGGSIDSGGKIGSGRSISSGGRISSGGSIDTNNTISSGGSIGGGEIVSGGSITSGGSISSGGNI